MKDQIGRMLFQTHRICRRSLDAVWRACSVALLVWLASLSAAGSGTPPAAIAGPPAQLLGESPLGEFSEPSVEPLDHSDLLLVGLSPSVSPQEADQIFAAAGVSVTRHWPEFSLAAVHVAPSRERSQDEAQAAARARLVEQRGVRYVETNWAIEAAGHILPDDPYFPEQWALEKINMPGAWDVTVGDPNLIVALIDSGLDVDHDDLADITLWANTIELNGLPGEDDDGNGYVDDFNGWDWVGNVNTFADPYGHGTHVGGVLTADTDNGIGVASVGRKLTLMPLRVLDERGSGFISYLVDALSYARRKGARIINLSLVLSFNSLAVNDALQAFVETGGLVVAATGNYGGQVLWPAAYPETIAVAATSIDDTRSPFSNRGPQTDLAAPGSLIVSTYVDNSYHLNDGTSMAVPHVSALAALIWSLRPDWDWQQVKEHLKATAADVNQAILPGPDSDIGHGRIDAEAALVQAAAGISFTVDYLIGQYTSVDQPLRIPMQLTIHQPNGGSLPVGGALIHYELLGSPAIGSGAGGLSVVLSGTVTSSTAGRAVLDMRTPSEVGNYTLHIRMAGQELTYPISLQDGPLVLHAQASQPTIQVGSGRTQLQFSARAGTPAELLNEPLLVELTTTLGTFSDGSQQRTLWMEDGMLTESLIAGTVAGVAEISVTAAGQVQRAFVAVQPGPPQRISGPARVSVDDWGEGALLPITLNLSDQYGNPIWNNTRVNFYTTHSSFAPQSPTVMLGKVETHLSLPGWLPSPVDYWAMIPGTFSIFRGKVVIMRSHLWLPQLTGTPAPSEE